MIGGTPAGTLPAPARLASHPVLRVAVQTQAIQPSYILHARPYRETSLLLEAFSRDHGRVGLVARGARGGRGQARRALLQPLQPLLLTWAGRGELMNLRSVEAASAALSLRGHALLCAFYVNELLVRLLPRGEPQDELFWRYTACLGQLAEPGAQLGWQLRRFERDLLRLLGYGLELDMAADDGAPLEARMRYVFETEAGPYQVATPTRSGAGGISGSSLICLREDRPPDARGLRELRGLMRAVLLHHLDGRPLRTWAVLDGVNEGMRAGAKPVADQDAS